MALGGCFSSNFEPIFGGGGRGWGGEFVSSFKGYAKMKFSGLKLRNNLHDYTLT